MSMALEFPFKIFILVVVVLVLITMMWQFRDRIMDMCLFPPCNGGEECDVEPVISNEANFTIGILDKYCNLCWIKNGGGKCKGDPVCYVLTLEEDFDPTVPWNMLKEYDYCVVTCESAISSLYVQYHSEGNGYVEIAC